MKRILFLSVLLVGAVSGSVSAQDDYDTLRISRGLDDIAYELRQLRYDAEYAGLGYYGGGYFPVPIYRPSRHQLRDQARYNTRLQRTADIRAGTAKKVRRTVVKAW